MASSALRSLPRGAQQNHCLHRLLPSCHHNHLATDAPVRRNTALLPPLTSPRVVALLLPPRVVALLPLPLSLLPPLPSPLLPLRSGTAATAVAAAAGLTAFPRLRCPSDAFPTPTPSAASPCPRPSVYQVCKGPACKNASSSKSSPQTLPLPLPPPCPPFRHRRTSLAAPVQVGDTAVPAPLPLPRPCWLSCSRRLCRCVLLVLLCLDRCLQLPARVHADLAQQVQHLAAQGQGRGWCSTPSAKHSSQNQTARPRLRKKECVRNQCNKPCDLTCWRAPTLPYMLTLVFIKLI